MAEDKDSPIGGPLELPEDAYPKEDPVKKPRKKGKIVLVILIVIIVLGAGGFALWKFVLNKDSKTTNNTSADSSQSSNSTASSGDSDIPDEPLTEEYTSGPLRLTFNYPKDWTVKEENGGIRVTSPDFSYQTLNSGDVNGNFRIYIRKGARTQDSTYIGKGVAILPSEKLTYTNPTSVQRPETNLSFFGLDDTNNFAFFLIAGNFELKKGDSLGPDYGKEAETYIIGGGYSGDALKDDLQTYQVSPDNFQNTNAYKQAIDILKSLQLK